jgi:hypothetical protein
MIKVRRYFIPSLLLLCLLSYLGNHSTKAQLLASQQKTIEHSVDNSNMAITSPIQLKITLTPSPSELPTIESTQISDKHKTPKPSPTPLLIPPPANENINKSIISFGLLSIIVVLFGLWLNREKISH